MSAQQPSDDQVLKKALHWDIKYDGQRQVDEMCIYKIVYRILGWFTQRVCYFPIKKSWQVHAKLLPKTMTRTLYRFLPDTCKKMVQDACFIMQESCQEPYIPQSCQELA